jgi:hypothetical protein
MKYMKCIIRKWMYTIPQVYMLNLYNGILYYYYLIQDVKEDIKDGVDASLGNGCMSFYGGLSPFQNLIL